jgi:hypothetical protein
MLVKGRSIAFMEITPALILLIGKDHAVTALARSIEHYEGNIEPVMHEVPQGSGNFMPSPRVCERQQEAKMT